MIASVTLNPAVDKILYIPSLARGKLSRIDRPAMLPGGKGVNIAVMLNKLGQEVLALGFLGGFVGEFIEERLRSEGISVAFQHVEGNTRTNIILVEPDGQNTKILEPGPTISPSDIEQFLGAYERSLSGYDTVIIAGSLPPGVNEDIYKIMVALAKKKGLFTIVNTYGPAFSAALEAAPDLVKPDVRLTSEVLGIDSSTEEGRKKIAQRLFAQGVGTLVIAFDQHGRAVYSTEGAFELTAPNHESSNAVIAGDAFLAGLVDALRRERPLEEAGVWAMAMEIAASQDPEKRWAAPDEVSRFLGHTKQKELA